MLSLQIIVIHKYTICITRLHDYIKPCRFELKVTINLTVLKATICHALTNKKKKIPQVQKEIKML